MQSTPGRKPGEDRRKKPVDQHRYFRRMRRNCGATKKRWRLVLLSQIAASIPSVAVIPAGMPGSSTVDGIPVTHGFSVAMHALRTPWLR